MKTLGASLDALYLAFDGVPKPEKIEGCPCCIEGKELSALLTKPLRELGADDLYSFTTSALLTVGDVPDFMYFLPRIVELACAEAGNLVDRPIIGRAIGQTDPMAWPASRRNAILDVLDAALSAELGCEGSGLSIDDWICTISKTGLDVTPFLSLVERSPGHVASFYEANSPMIQKGRLANPFWGREEEGYRIVLDWFQCPRVFALVQEGFGLS